MIMTLSISFMMQWRIISEVSSTLTTYLLKGLLNLLTKGIKMDLKSARDHLEYMMGNFEKYAENNRAVLKELDGVLEAFENREEGTNAYVVRMALDHKNSLRRDEADIAAIKTVLDFLNKLDEPVKFEFTSSI
ncbi:hypothetical protein Ab1vBOLIVR5_gp175 [Agrobacterium phage OLIVR5]|uniref:Uncharacterized protein n=1 Tax=Agrobacterium phage OLIVR5 TaxID=2723773 RepID=A0A858MTH7_9CAUD|nr:hypothetical protein KNU99_gp226 [Agrobacterium phage OLIVR5]QIW87823.1 hypothetical protein Ab1vBOLIVR5_gp175 [Agrobacterium phage OLIVR5]QIW88088.1 hypothetical protein Ab1vBOLIVR6_gp181 [Agrobacterium phage OLIVR6]